MNGLDMRERIPMLCGMDTKEGAVPNRSALEKCLELAQKNELLRIEKAALMAALESIDNLLSLYEADVEAEGSKHVRRVIVAALRAAGAVQAIARGEAQ